MKSEPCLIMSTNVYLRGKQNNIVQTFKTYLTFHNHVIYVRDDDQISVITKDFQMYFIIGWYR